MVKLPAKLRGFLADCFLLGTAESVESHYQEIRTSYEQVTKQVPVSNVTTNTQQRSVNNRYLVVSMQSRFSTNQSLHQIRSRCVSNPLKLHVHIRNQL